MEADLPWTEKYRPKKLKELVGQEEIVKRLESYASAKNLPNLLFAGRAGIGKTAAAIALAHELYGDEFGRNFLELNASDERGIGIIRGKIKDFAATLSLGDVPFKIIFLDESDALTKDAQNALRRTMEKYSRTCRFILSCNYSSKLIPPIQSRCALFRFSPLTEGQVKQRLNYIAEKEGLHVDEKALDALVYVADGDMRKAINTLQVASATSKKITEDTIYKVASRARPEEVKKMIQLAIKGDFIKARSQLDKLLYEYSLSGEDVISQVYSEVVSDDSIEDKAKLELVKAIGETDFRLTEGSNERIQIEAFLAQLALIGKK
ncbi:MAG: replication factor C small subunit [Candidatus Diapherotrites archaeon]|nr:replication factor C small subunit [Candidatus Diapherotrites archaeon]